MRLPRTKTRGARVALLATAMLAVAAVAAGIARSTAAEPIPDANGVIHACYKKPIGPVRIVYNEANCGRGETPIEWNQTGVQGPKGETGPQGPQGPQGETGPQGPSGAGTTVRDAGEYLLAPDEELTIRPTCASGERPIAGLYTKVGFALVTRNELDGSFDAGDHWTFTVVNQLDDKFQGIRFYVVCIEFP